MIIHIDHDSRKRILIREIWPNGFCRLSDAKKKGMVFWDFIVTVGFAKTFSTRSIASDKGVTFTISVGVDTGTPLPFVLTGESIFAESNYSGNKLKIVI